MDEGKSHMTSPHNIYCYPVNKTFTKSERFACFLPEPVPAPAFQSHSVLSGKVRRMHTQYRVSIRAGDEIVNVR